MRGYALRKVARHGGSLWVPLPSEFVIRLGVVKHDPVVLMQPFSDVVCVVRPDCMHSRSDSPLSQAVTLFCDESWLRVLEDKWAGVPAADGLGCSMCGLHPAETTYMSISACRPCKRELVAAAAMRSAPSAAELDVSRS